MRVFAAEVVQEAMLRPHEFDVDLAVVVPARPTIVDQELDVDPLLVHVADAPIDVPVVAEEVRGLAPHEPSRGPGSRSARLCLAERAWDVSSPATDGSAAEAETRRIRRVVRNARRMPTLGGFATFEVRQQLADPGREILFERVSRWPDVSIAVVDFVAVSHCDPSSTRGRRARRCWLDRVITFPSLGEHRHDVAGEAAQTLTPARATP